MRAKSRVVSGLVLVTLVGPVYVGRAAGQEPGAAEEVTLSAAGAVLRPDPDGRGSRGTTRRFLSTRQEAGWTRRSTELTDASHNG